MSMGGPSPLGTLLIQRLDAVLGTTSGQQTNIVTGARPDAVSQSAPVERNLAVQNSTDKHPRETVDQIARQGQQKSNAQVHQGAQLDHRQSAIEALLRHTNTSATASAPTTLSRAARTILEIIERFPQGSTPLIGKRPIVNEQRVHSLLTAAASQTQRPPSHPQQTSSSLNTTAPLAPNTPASQRTGLDQLVHYLTQNLRRTIQHSGMFYESQLALFTFGKASQRSLKQQPQNTLLTEPAKPVPPTQQEGTKATQNQDQPQQRQHNTPGGTPTHTALDTEFAHQNLIRQQLEVLATQQVFWRGEAWAHTPLEWLIEREQEHKGFHNHKQTANSDRWNSSLRMQLDGLGDIEFKISLHNQHVSLQIQASDSASILQAHLPRLNDRLALQGLNIEHVSLSSESVPNTNQAASDD